MRFIQLQRCEYSPCHQDHSSLRRKAGQPVSDEHQRAELPFPLNESQGIYETADGHKVRMYLTNAYIEFIGDLTVVLILLMTTA